LSFPPFFFLTTVLFGWRDDFPEDFARAGAFALGAFLTELLIFFEPLLMMLPIFDNVEPVFMLREAGFL